MEIIDLIAILGALAWLPQIISWVYHRLKKPTIKVFNDNIAEVGFIKFGNAFNIRLSFLARYKNALIDNIELIIKDKNGATHNLKWIWYSETLYELQAVTGNAIMAKQQQAIAINAYKDVLIEKLVGFQSESFLETRKNLAYKLNTFIENQKSVGEIDVETIKRSQEYNDILRFYKSELFWISGDYSVICKIHIVDKKEPIEHLFNFTLSDIEIETLRRNIEFSEKVLALEFFNKEQTLEGNWFWATPNVYS